MDLSASSLLVLYAADVDVWCSLCIFNEEVFSHLMLLLQFLPDDLSYCCFSGDVQDAVGGPQYMEGLLLQANPGRQAAFDVPNERLKKFESKTDFETPVSSGVRIRQDFRESWIWTEVSIGYYNGCMISAWGPGYVTSWRNLMTGMSTLVL